MMQKAVGLGIAGGAVLKIPAMRNARMGSDSSELPSISGIPDKFQIGLVLGVSGSGKTRLIKSLFGQPVVVSWIEGKAIVSQFPCPKSSELNTKGAADEGIDRFQHFLITEH